MVLLPIAEIDIGQLIYLAFIAGIIAVMAAGLADPPDWPRGGRVA
jgi:hypothetical protein